MNGKFDEKLARLAFGDTDEVDAARLQEMVEKDPGAAKRLAEYRMMRSALEGMRDVPPDQLSKERLRSAILKEGLKPKDSPSGGMGWIWAPVATCALAFVFGTAVLKSRSHSVPVLIPSGAPLAATPPVALGPVRDSVSPDSTVAFNSTSDEIAGPPSPRVISTSASRRSTASGVRRRRNHRSIEPLTDAMATILISRDASGYGLFIGPAAVGTPSEGSSMVAFKPAEHVEFGPGPIPTSSPRGMAANGPVSGKPEASSAAAPIVLIAQDKPDDKGTQNATEGNSSNVLVGG